MSDITVNVVESTYTILISDVSAVNILQVNEPIAVNVEDVVQNIVIATQGTKGDPGTPGAPGSTNHFLLTNIGINTHVQIDSHISNTSNPHSVTKTQVGLGNVLDLDQSNPANIVQTATFRFATDAEKAIWNGKQNALGFTPANNSLSNLVGTAINQTLLPDTDQAYDLGASGQNWNNVRAKAIGFDGGTAINLDTKKMFDGTTVESIDFEARVLKDSTSLSSVQYGVRALLDNGGSESLNWQARYLADDSEVLALDYLDRRLFANDGTTPVIDWSSPTGATATTQSAGDNSTKIATTAYVDSIPRLNPSGFVYFFDDFIGSQANSAIGFNAVNSGTGATNTSSVGGALGALGVYQFATGSTAAGRSSTFAGASAILPGQGIINYTWRVRISNLSDTINTFTSYIGFGDNAGAGDMVDGVYFIYTHSLNAGNWTLSTSNSNVRTQANSGVAAAALTWVKLGVRINAAGNSAEYFIGGISVGTITTNIPIAAGRETGPIAKIQKSLGTSSRLLQVDYFYMDYTPTTPR